MYYIICFEIYDVFINSPNNTTLFYIFQAFIHFFMLFLYIFLHKYFYISA